MNVELLARLQFALTVGFHYIFPQLSIGLAVVLVVLEALHLRTGKPVYLQATKFWAKVFALTFALGVATGIVMEFEFGTNWAAYSRFVGDVFGSALAAEGIFAFFLESGFLAILLFGWNRVGPKTHFFSTVMVCLGAHLSAVWIVVANSWMQTPAGYHLVGEAGSRRAEITDFWALVFNPSTVDRLTHTLVGAWQAGAFLVVAVAAWYALKGRHADFARVSMRVGLVFAAVASLLSLATGDMSAKGVARNQPAKLAAFEGVYPDGEPGALTVLGWVDEKNERVIGIQLPGMLSWMAHGDASAPVIGLRAFPPGDRPPVQLVFQSFHAMVGIGMALIGLSLLAAFLDWRGKLLGTRTILWALVLSSLGPQIANQLGWMTAEVGRQPWIVYNLMRTSEGISRSVGAGEVWISLVGFALVYLLLLLVFLFLLGKKIEHGPLEKDVAAGRNRA